MFKPAQFEATDGFMRITFRKEFMTTLFFASAALLCALAVATTDLAEGFNGPSVGVQAGWSQNDVRNPTTDLGVATIMSDEFFNVYDLTGPSMGSNDKL